MRDFTLRYADKVIPLAALFVTVAIIAVILMSVSHLEASSIAIFLLGVPAGVFSLTSFAMMFTHCLRHKQIRGRTTWIVAFLIGTWLCSFVYYLFVYRRLQLRPGSSLAKPSTDEILRRVLPRMFLTLITPIGTLYKGEQASRHSGTGLILSDSSGHTFVLTANHVVEPHLRSSPVKREVIKHEYVENIGRVTDDGKVFEEDANLIPPFFRLRRKFYKCEGVDLALLDSCLSGHEFPGVKRDRYYPLEYVESAKFPDTFDDDILVFSGFPEALHNFISATKERNFGSFTFVFKGMDGDNHPTDGALYSVGYDSASPAAMSGSPVWLVRQNEKPLVPLSLEYVRQQEKLGSHVRLTTWFVGVVVRYDQESKQVYIVRPEICAEFVRQACEVMPFDRDPAEEEQIEEQLQWFDERYGDKYRRTTQMKGDGLAKF